jgi:hypothetical protein
MNCRKLILKYHPQCFLVGVVIGTVFTIIEEFAPSEMLLARAPFDVCTLAAFFGVTGGAVAIATAIVLSKIYPTTRVLGCKYHSKDVVTEQTRQPSLVLVGLVTLLGLGIFDWQRMSSYQMAQAEAEAEAEAGVCRVYTYGRPRHDVVVATKNPAAHEGYAVFIPGTPFPGGAGKHVVLTNQKP